MVEILLKIKKGCEIMRSINLKNGIVVGDDGVSSVLCYNRNDACVSACSAFFLGI